MSEVKLPDINNKRGQSRDVGRSEGMGHGAV